MCESDRICQHNGTDRASARSGTNMTITPENLGIYHFNGFGQWTYAEGVPIRVRNELAGGEIPANKGTTLLSFATISDIHITDEEFPLQVIALGYLTPFHSAYSPVSMFTTQVLNAAVRTINDINKTDGVDLVLSLGDAVNNAQYNELRWFIDVLDGKAIDPTSGGNIGKKISITRRHLRQKVWRCPGIRRSEIMMSSIRECSRWMRMHAGSFAAIPSQICGSIFSQQETRRSLGIIWVFSMVLIRMVR